MATLISKVLSVVAAPAALLPAQTNWTRVVPAVSPPARQSPALAYDWVRQRVVLFGGIGAAGRLSDTWEWDGTNWVQPSPATSPPARNSHALAFDVGRGRVVLFGGASSNTTTLGDTWEWDGVSWAQRNPAASPPARYGAAPSRLRSAN